MTIKSSIDSYRKKRNQGNLYVIIILVALLILVGIILVLVSLGGEGGGIGSIFATKTPTPTITPTPTSTSTPTSTPTITPTSTETPTPTPSAPFLYTVQEGEYLLTIVEKYNLGDNGVVLILLLNPYDEATGTGIDPQTGIVYVGQQITLPYPGMPLPTPTPLPTNIAAGARITYFILPGENLAFIASKMNSTVEAIIAANPEALPDGEASVIYPGQLILVPVNLVTPTITPLPTVTETPTP